MTSRISRLTYAVGDVHGYDSLFAQLIEHIRVDAAAAQQKPVVILLGDYVDRGPNSRAVLERILNLEREPWCELIALRGNHEDAVLKFLADPSTGPVWREWGGAATLASYGVDMPFMADDPKVWTEVRDRFAEVLDSGHLDLLRRMPAAHLTDDYLFVHAGVDPDMPLSEQGPQIFTTMRARFMRAEKSCDYTVVHGHTPEDEPANLRWRIGVDSGVYFRGRLTAVRLEDTERRFLQVSDHPAQTAI